MNGVTANRETERIRTMFNDKELLDLWRIARTALADRPPSRYDRMQWTVAAYRKAHPECPLGKRLYLHLEELTEGY